MLIWPALNHAVPVLICFFLLEFSTAGFVEEPLADQLKIENDSLIMFKIMKEMEQFSNEMDQLKSNFIDEKSKNSNNRATIVNIDLPRSCFEIKEFNPNLISGEYIIDPDGMHVGSDPITVLCDGATGATLISHDSEKTRLETGNCLTPGCYTQSIIYAAPYKQIEALAEISDTCSQYFEYQCIVSPFEYNGAQYIYWVDRSGNSNYYWAGSNTTRHTCQCGLNATGCSSFGKWCNCDSYSNILQKDSGNITEKDALPIQRLKFGKPFISFEVNGAFTLGKFKCMGRAVVNGMPTSCRDVYRMGHIFSDFHLIKRKEKIEMVFCDFSLSPFDPRYETRLGYGDLKSSQIYFDVAKTSDFGLIGSTITWEYEKLNTGHAFNLVTGIFTAPVSGRYFFSFVGKSSQAFNVVTNVWFVVQGVVQADVFDTTSYTSSNAPIQTTVELKKGNIVYIILASGKIDAKSRFTGWLVEEDSAI